MAENAITGQEPHLRKGRSADPRPAGDKRPPVAAEGETAPQARGETAKGSRNGEPFPQSDPAAEGEAEGKEQERIMARSRQRHLRLLLRQCDRVMLMDFELLAMSDWPDNFTLAAARRNRDLWVFSAVVAALLFLSGLTGFVPAWIAGGGFGAFVVIVLLGLPGIRRIYTSRPSYLDLILERRQMMQDARKHVAHLEGKEGLAWQCARLAEFNPALRSPRFRPLVSLSEHRVLARNLTRREHIRLFLVFLLEAEKAYRLLESSYLKEHHRALDEGWQPGPGRAEVKGSKDSGSVDVSDNEAPAGKDA
ncbi:MAG: hypothetical protein SVX28_01740 [Pseudomonadota bacterium]|nr:hypothetical protein [Pseudomonadota bacterium]